MEANAKRILGIHFGLFTAEALCVSAFIVEIQRALSGNTLSWAYVIEWPIFSIYAVYLWRKLLNDERHPHQTELAPTSEHDDRALLAYNEYLAKMHGPAADESDST